MFGGERDTTTVFGSTIERADEGRTPNDEEHNEKVFTAEAQIGFSDEKELGPWAARKAYPYAVMWSLVMASCVIMEGYDTALLGSFFAYRTGKPPLSLSFPRPCLWLASRLTVAD